MGSVGLEVRSRKLDYRTDYRAMVEQVAEFGAELIQERFAASESSFLLDTSLSAESLYQRFAFLKSMIESDRLKGALERVFERPYEEWDRVERLEPVGRSVPSGSYLGRAVTRPGRRVEHAGFDFPLPALVPRSSFVEATDNLPNRFVNFVLEHWRSLLAILDLGIRKHLRDGSSPALVRALDEIEAVNNYLEACQRRPPLRDVGDLVNFPPSNPVLERREGYREIYEAFVLSDAGVRISWAPADDVIGAGQRDVATLYEYWVFLKLAEIVESICGRLDKSRLVTLSSSGISLLLNRGESSVVNGSTSRNGYLVNLRLFFNQAFGPLDEAWTRAFRPDCTLSIEVDTPERGHEVSYLHFDAKYRLSTAAAFVGTTEINSHTRARSDDISKMHTYRDAIRLAVGAYVIFPGDRAEYFKEYHEILPGLGAFPLTPRADGGADGVGKIEEFINAAITHLTTETIHSKARAAVRKILDGA